MGMGRDWEERKGVGRGHLFRSTSRVEYECLLFFKKRSSDGETRRERWEGESERRSEQSRVKGSTRPFGR